MSKPSDLLWKELNGGPYSPDKVETFLNMEKAAYASMDPNSLAADWKRKHKEREQKAGFSPSEPVFIKSVLVSNQMEPPQEDTPANYQKEMLVWYPRKLVGDGYSDNTQIVSDLCHYNVQDLLARFFVQCHAQWGKIPNWRENIIGCTSYYFNTSVLCHMPMFDYDGKNVKKVLRKDVKLLQETNGLGDAWVYETRRGFHVYFFCDSVTRNEYYAMLDATECCKGFRRMAKHKGFAVLRVSAKYTDFDIKPLYVLPAKDGKLRRMTRKAHTIRALLDLGGQCGTHFASMFPQWAYFQEDRKEWKPAVKGPVAKRIKKATSFNMKLEKMVSINSPPPELITFNTTTTTADNMWITKNSGTTGDW